MPASATSRRCSSTLSRIQVLADLEALGDDLLGHLGSAGLIEVHAASVPPASTIMMATSPSSSWRPATTSSKAEASPSW